MKASHEKIVSELAKVVKNAKGKLSPEDAASATGRRIDEINDGFNRLLELYRSRVQMDSDTGRLKFVFDYPLKKRGSKTFREVLFELGNALWKIFQIIYKAAIGVVLIMYTVIFLVILLALMFGGRGNDRDGGPNIGPIMAGLFRGISEAFMWSYILRPYDYDTDAYGMHYKRIRPEKNKGKGFIKSVFSFVFGPERPKYDPLEDAKEAAAFIRRHGGKITAGDIVALTGVDYPEAESRLAEYTGRFRGMIDIAEDGTVTAEFPDMENKISKELKGGEIIYYEDEVDAPWEVTGNSTGRNFAIGAMNTFNLVMANVVIGLRGNPIETSAYEEPGTATQIINAVAGSDFLIFGLGWFPLIFSIMFFLIPIFRYFYVKKKQGERENNILRKRLTGAIIRAASPISSDNLLKLARIQDKHLKRGKKILDKLVIDYRGSINIAEDGTAMYSFERLWKEALN